VLACRGVGDRRFGGSLRHFSDEHRSGLRFRLDPGRRVDQVAGDHPLALGAERNRRLAGENARPRVQRRVEIGDGSHEVEACSNRALRVVLGGDRRAPHGHDRVADELFYRAAVALDDRAGGVEVAGEELTRLLGVAAFGGGREAHEVGEEHGDEAAFCRRRCNRCGRRRGSF
jgi:hypothetical protein